MPTRLFRPVKSRASKQNNCIDKHNPRRYLVVRGVTRRGEIQTNLNFKTQLLNLWIVEVLLSAHRSPPAPLAPYQTEPIRERHSFVAVRLLQILDYHVEDFLTSLSLSDSETLLQDNFPGNSSPM